MFSFLYCFFCWTEAFQFDVVPLADFALVACVLGGHMNKIVAKTDVKLLFLSEQISFHEHWFHDLCVESELSQALGAPVSWCL